MNTKINMKFDLSQRKCKDEIIGALEYDSSSKEHDFNVHINYKNKIIRNRNQYIKIYGDEIKDYKRLAIILESPHVDEFDVKGFNCKSVIGNRPANGKTGQRFKKNFAQIINNKFSSKLGMNNYLIYLVNSIQYQCSLGIETKVFRDYCWLSLWKQKGIRDLFLSRIKEINPNVIINCCTLGGHKRNINNGIIDLKDCSPNQYIKTEYLKELGYIVQDKVIKDSKSRILLEYDKVGDINLKSFIRYQLMCIYNYKGIYEELNHPINWY